MSLGKIPAAMPPDLIPRLYDKSRQKLGRLLKSIQPIQSSPVTELIGCPFTTLKPGLRVTTPDRVLQTGPKFKKTLVDVGLDPQLANRARSGVLAGPRGYPFINLA